MGLSMLPKYVSSVDDAESLHLHSALPLRPVFRIGPVSPPAADIESPSGDIRPTMDEFLYRYHSGWYPCFAGDDDGNGPVGPIVWRKYSHRGIQWLDEIHIGKKQFRDIFNAHFEFRISTDFPAVLRGCSDLSRQGATWITPHIASLFVDLHEMGFAHSFECWQDGKLVGGCFGMQLGSIMTIESMFHHVDNASKCAYVRALLHLRERGYHLIDVNNATPFFERFGAKTIPQWKFEELMRAHRKVSVRMSDDASFPHLPISLRLQLPLSRLVHAVERRVLRLAA